VRNRSEAVAASVAAVACEDQRVVESTVDNDNDESTNSPPDNTNRDAREDDCDNETFSIDSIEGI